MSVIDTVSTYRNFYLFRMAFIASLSNYYFICAIMQMQKGDYFLYETLLVIFLFFYFHFYQPSIFKFHAAAYPTGVNRLCLQYRRGGASISALRLSFQDPYPSDYGQEKCYGVISRNKKCQRHHGDEDKRIKTAWTASPWGSLALIGGKQLRGKRSNIYIRTWSQFRIYLTALDNQLIFTDGVYISACHFRGDLHAQQSVRRISGKGKGIWGFSRLT